MNRKLYLLAAALGLFIGGSVNAQTAVSFESSEGYSLGDINGQNGWIVTGNGSGGFISNQTISSSMASQGTQSLKIDQDTNFGGQQNLVMGAFYDFAGTISGQYSISADVNVSALNGADFMMGIAGNTNFISQFITRYTGDVQVVDFDTTSQQLVYVTVPGLSWSPNTWYNIKMEVDGTGVKYYVDDNLVYTGDAISTEPFSHMRFVHDNYGGFAHIDNIVVTGTVGVNEIDKFVYTIAPNPAVDVINITMEENKNIQGVHLTDMNGRTVKTFDVRGVNQAMLNVSDLASGVYFLNVSADGITVAKKIIKK